MAYCGSWASGFRRKPNGSARPAAASRKRCFRGARNSGKPDRPGGRQTRTPQQPPKRRVTDIPMARRRGSYAPNGSASMMSLETSGNGSATGTTRTITRSPRIRIRKGPETGLYRVIRGGGWSDNDERSSPCTTATSPTNLALQHRRVPLRVEVNPWSCASLLFRKIATASTLLSLHYQLVFQSQGLAPLPGRLLKAAHYPGAARYRACPGLFFHPPLRGECAPAVPKIATAMLRLHPLLHQASAKPIFMRLGARPRAWRTAAKWPNSWDAPLIEAPC